MIKRSVSGEAWSVIDFQEKDLSCLVYHEVESKYLKAHVVLYVMWLGHPILMLQMRLPSYHRLHDNVLDAGPILVGWKS